MASPPPGATPAEREQGDAKDWHKTSLVLPHSKTSRQSTQHAHSPVKITCRFLSPSAEQRAGIIIYQSRNTACARIHYRQAFSTKTEYITTSTKKPRRLYAHPTRHLKRDHTDLLIISIDAVPGVLSLTEIPGPLRPLTKDRIGDYAKRERGI